MSRISFGGFCQVSSAEIGITKASRKDMRRMRRVYANDVTVTSFTNYLLVGQRGWKKGSRIEMVALLAVASVLLFFAGVSLLLIPQPGPYWSVGRFVYGVL